MREDIVFYAMLDLLYMKFYRYTFEGVCVCVYVCVCVSASALAFSAWCVVPVSLSRGEGGEEGFTLL